MSNELNDTILDNKELIQYDNKYKNLSDDEKEKIRQEWEEKNFHIHKEKFSFSEAFSNALIKIATDWNKITQLLEEVIQRQVPDFLNPKKIPDRVDLFGYDDKDDVIDKDGFFNKENLFAKEAYVILGGKGHDTLIGGQYNDYLDGGDDNDTLKGKAGDDEMVGGSGSDTYHIEGNDTIYDKDINGKVLFNNGTTELQAIRFQRIDDTSEKWIGIDDKNNKIEGLTATRQNNDLFLEYAYEKTLNEEGNSINVPFTDSALIKNFFNLAKSKEPTDGNKKPEWNGLSIFLQNKPLDKPADPTQTALAADKRFNVFRIDETDLAAKVQGGTWQDIVFAHRAKSLTAEMGDGDDLVYGSFGVDKIDGGAGRDVINGSILTIGGKKPEELAADRDTIIGGDGRDLLNGVAGDDVIYTGNQGEQLKSETIDEQGDWALGDLGDDIIHGGQRHDFLLGGSGEDVIHGGAGHDVILGDAHIRFDTKTAILGGSFPSVEVVAYPHGMDMHNIAGSAIVKEHSITSIGTSSIDQYSFSARHNDTFDWSVAIDRDKGDYTLNSKLRPVQNLHLAENGGNDTLYGGEASVGWALVAHAVHTVGILPSFFYFQPIFTNPTNPRYFRQPERSQLKYRDIFKKNTM